MIAVFSHDRAFRVAVDSALRAAGVRVRLASRQAELAKALTGDDVRALIVGPLPEDRAAADTVCAGTGRTTLPVRNTTPDEAIGEIVRRALDLHQR